MPRESQPSPQGPTPRRRPGCRAQAISALAVRAERAARPGYGAEDVLRRGGESPHLLQMAAVAHNAHTEPREKRERDTRHVRLVSKNH